MGAVACVGGRRRRRRRGQPWTHTWLPLGAAVALETSLWPHPGSGGHSETIVGLLTKL